MSTALVPDFALTLLSMSSESPFRTLLNPDSKTCILIFNVFENIVLHTLIFFPWSLMLYVLENCFLFVSSESSLIRYSVTFLRRKSYLFECSEILQFESASRSTGSLDRTFWNCFFGNGETYSSPRFTDYLMTFFLHDSEVQSIFLVNTFASWLLFRFFPLSKGNGSMAL